MEGDPTFPQPLGAPPSPAWAKNAGQTRAAEGAQGARGQGAQQARGQRAAGGGRGLRGPFRRAGMAGGWGPGRPIRGLRAVVTGGNRGIGRALVEALLAREGTSVLAACRDVGRAESTLASLLQEFPGRLALSELDAASPESIARWAGDGVGPGHIDLLINNAGVYGSAGHTKRMNVEDVTEEEMLLCFRTNTVGPLIVVQQLLKAGKLGGAAPSLVGNVTSKVGSVADNGSGGGYAYRASKAAINVVNKSLSIDLAERNVESVLLHPGWVQTDMTQGQGFITARESAEGMLKILETPGMNGKWFDYKGEEVPW